MASGIWLILASIIVFHRVSKSCGETCLPNRGEVLVRSDHRSNEHSPVKSGQFHSPNWPKNYNADSRCVYRFVAGIGEKVRVEMNYFHLTGEMPHCNGDFLDVYIDVASSSLDIDRESALLSYLASGELHTTTPFSAATYSSVLDQSALLGRYCGGHSSHRPTVFISLHREIVLDFYASTNRINNNRLYNSKQTYGFNGSFEFISDAVFYPGRALSANEMRLPYKFPTTSGCRFRVTSNAERIVDQDFSSPQSSDTTGELISPTYPGFHPDGLFCLYQLVGTQTQRINIDVLDVDLPTQDSTCPIDYLNFYDGLSMEASKSILGTPFCGSGKRIRIVSSGSAFLILFVTGTWSAISWDESGIGSRSKRQGFRLLYHFSETFLPISLKYSMNHIRGTECDYLIRSHGLTEATFESPTSKGGRLLYPDRLCTFYFMGTFQRQYLETVRITFDHLVLPKPSGSGERCDMGFLSMYGIRDLNSFYQFKEPTFMSNHIFWDPLLTADEMLCSRKEMLDTVRVGTDIEKAPIRARHSFMAMQLNSTGAQLPGMKAEFRLRYRFERGFAVPGLQSNATNCHFIYTPLFPTWMRNNAEIRHGTSTARLHRSGWTNSPFYPLPYPSNITCVYMFLSQHISSSGNTSAIRLSFGHFELTSVESFPTSETSPLDGRPQCNRDFLEVVAIRGEITSTVLNQLVSQPAPNLPARTRHWEHSWRNYWNTMNRGLQSLSGGQRSFIDPIAAYCGTNIPGPFLSDPGVTAFLVRFHSGRNAKHGGFTLKYEFVEHQKGECGGNIGSFLHGGVIESPKHPQPYPHNLDCRWQLQISNPENVIQLHFDAFYLSANIGNCSQAVLRIYTGAATDHLAELCTNQTAMTPLLLPGASVTIRFTALRNDRKATGFRIFWTEIFPALKDGTCEDFQCAHSKHCISNHLVCDGTPNCGVYSKANRLDPDDSDENANCNFSSGAGAITYNFVHIAVGVIMTFVLLFVLIGIVYYRERKRRRMQMDPLAELTGSKHSLAPSQASNKSYHRQSHPRKCDTGHAHIHSRQNSRTHLSMNNSRTSVYSSTYRSSKRHPRSQDRRTNHIVPRSNLIPSHNCTSRYQLIPIHNLPKQSSHHSPGRHRSKSPCRMTHGHSCTLRRTGSHRSGSSRSGRMSHGATSCVLSGDNDSGHLTRERMQTISIV